jgi:hypothetical protein
MKVERNPNGLEVLLFSVEAYYLRKALIQVAQNYRIHPVEFDDQTAEVWYSPQGHASVDAYQEDKDIWNESLFEFRNTRLGDLQIWIEDLTEGREFYLLPLTFEKADTLVSIINDHRLLVAAEHDFSKEELDQNLDEVDEEDKREALMEVHVLAFFIEMILAELNN